MLPLIEKCFPVRWSAGRRKLGADIDNAPAQNSRRTQNFFRHNPLKRLLHPPYSFDVYGSDFYLFRKIKIALIKREIPDEINLLDAVTEILNGISDAEL
jgi:hypothetical protein